MGRAAAGGCATPCEPPAKLERKQPVPAGSFQEYRDVAGICRVCGQLVPPLSATRQDGLRVCGEESCWVETRRRYNNIKQRRYYARLRTQKGMLETASI